MYSSHSLGMKESFLHWARGHLEFGVILGCTLWEGPGVSWGGWTEPWGSSKAGLRGSGRGTDVPSSAQETWVFISLFIAPQLLRLTNNQSCSSQTPLVGCVPVRQQGWVCLEDPWWARVCFASAVLKGPWWLPLPLPTSHHAALWKRSPRAFLKLVWHWVHTTESSPTGRSSEDWVDSWAKGRASVDWPVTCDRRAGMEKQSACLESKLENVVSVRPLGRDWARTRGQVTAKGAQVSGLWWHRDNRRLGCLGGPMPGSVGSLGTSPGLPRWYCIWMRSKVPEQREFRGTWLRIKSVGWNHQPRHSLPHFISCCFEGRYVHHSRWVSAIGKDIISHNLDGKKQRLCDAYEIYHLFPRYLVTKSRLKSSCNFMGTY